ncbi:DUF4232 domain-containing protein [Streptomyces sp. NPDC090052]|uniref:DUF4232 domain-containing protein n=1 Tax=unclassified Streptomyces TaxID=2593676 RepID=UPI002256E5AA|nr:MULTISPECIES: DUF4232 domain-containing protein [unclassified Streptomyces]MCX4724605.1 DUF4232 domain-containing protein [Streptomyces sp. NBC_01306]
MRVKKISALALVVAAAGLSLTACGSSDGSNASAANNSSSTSTAASGSTGSKGSTSGSSASGSSSSSSSNGSGTNGKVATKSESAGSGARCDADHLALSAASAGVKNQLVINMKNTGSSTCSMHGFPGVQLIGPDGLGDTGPDAARTDASGSTMTIAPGEETRFLLHYIPDTSGNGKTYTRLAVTPPNERVSEIVNLNKLAITVSPSTGNAPDVYVDPIGYHTGSGK